MCVCVQKEKARQERIADWDRHQKGIEQLSCVCMCTKREGQAGENSRLGQTSEGHRTVVLCVYVYRNRRRPGRREQKTRTDIRRA